MMRGNNVYGRQYRTFVPVANVKRKINFQKEASSFTRCRYYWRTTSRRGGKQTFPNSGLLEEVFQEGGLAPYAKSYSQAVDMPCLGDKHADRRGKKIKVWSIHMEGVLVREVPSITVDVETARPPKDNGCCEMYFILDRDPNPVSKPNFNDLFEWKSNDPRISCLIRSGELSRFKLIKRRRSDMPFENLEAGALTRLHISEYVEFKKRRRHLPVAGTTGGRLPDVEVNRPSQTRVCWRKSSRKGALRPIAEPYSQAVDMPYLGDKHADRRGKKIKVWSIHMERVLVREVPSVTMDVETARPPKDNSYCEIYFILDRDPNPVSKPNFNDVFDWKSSDPRIGCLIRSVELSRFKLVKHRRIDMPFENLEPGALTRLHISEYVEFKYGSQLIAEFRRPFKVFLGCLDAERLAAMNSVIVDPYWPIGAARKDVLGREIVDDVLDIWRLLSSSCSAIPPRCSP
ncbi:hypothetical protein RHGRI_027241 [Rhododendron griersonianum]|uniref:Uncharacterized protein n=1 Tax=Rhododendron griersonianum TaxID=479676 RepID=A0AAV6J062_9ERIC|nr:hypothetical protein RHGRI_027241 [Rhododendron griersonianum]